MRSYKICRFSNLNTRHFVRTYFDTLWSLTLNMPGSMMKYYLGTLKDQDDGYYSHMMTHHAKALLVKNGCEVVAWALILNNSEIQVFVKPSYRRRGIGRALMKEARRWTHRKLFGCPWNDRARFFFEETGGTGKDQ